MSEPRIDQEQTDETTGSQAEVSVRDRLVLTIAYHPDPLRIGERAIITGPTELSRNSPDFSSARGAKGRPLSSKQISRTPLLISEGRTRRAVRIEGENTKARIGGASVQAGMSLDPETLRSGVVVELGAVVLLLHQEPRLRPAEASATESRIVGRSAAIERIRRQSARAANHDIPVLILGETGTGKELVAREIHRLSDRSHGPFVAVNMAAIPPTMAPSALFGHIKGAFTGAAGASAGFFGAADGGTLFLDEIGDSSNEVQTALLRALESGEVQPVGADSTRTFDVRVVAATDSELRSPAHENGVRLSLVMRLAGYEVRLPPLRERRDDISLLLVHFLAQELDLLGRSERLSPRANHKEAWLPNWLASHVLAHPWRGNVRELQHFARQLVIDYADAPRIGRDAGEALHLLRREHEELSSDSTTQSPPPSRRRSLEGFDEDELFATLQRHQFRPGPAADELGIARSSLYALIERSPRLRKASDLGADDIRAALGASSTVSEAASSLNVSARALRARIRRLGIVIPYD